MSQSVCVITGGSRGIGAETALILAKRGADIAFNFLSKEPRARAVAEQIEEFGRRGMRVQADLTDADQLTSFTRRVRSEFGTVNGLILNAAGGLERDRDDGYAYALNVTASNKMVDELLPIMPAGSVIVFVTSHMSHFYDRLPVVSGYERVASTKKIAEESLRARIPEFSAAGVRLAVVSGDLIDGTINARLMDRQYADLIAKREREVGPLPTIEEFSTAIADTIVDPQWETGKTVFVGSTAWETYNALHRQECGR